jgi:hypothetical protein
MAALVLSIAGAAAGSAVLGPVGAIVGRLVGAVAGNVIDQALFGARRQASFEGPRLSDLTVMASTEGAPIARVYALLNVRFGPKADKLLRRSDCPLSAKSRHSPIRLAWQPHAGLSAIWHGSVIVDESNWIVVKLEIAPTV